MTTVAGLNVGISGDPSALINALNQSTRAVTQFGNQVQQMNGRVNTSALSISRLLAAVGVGISVREVANYADAWTGVQARLALVTGSTDELKRVTNELFRIAQANRSEFESTATLYTRLRQSQRQLGLESADFMRITRTVSQALAIEGRSATEVSSTIRQLSQAFGAGRLAGDELRSVAENASLLFNQIAQNLGLSTGELRKLSSEGKISIQQVAQAILDAGDTINAQASRLPTTIGGAITQLRNSVQRFVGETDKALGITTKLVGMINSLGDAFDNNRAAIETFAFVIGAAVLVKAVNAARLALLQLAGVQLLTTILSLVPAITSLRDVMYLASVAGRAMWAAITGPVGLAIIGITAAAAIFFKWRKSIDETRKATAELKEGIGKLSPTELTQAIDTSLRDLTRLRARALEMRDEIALATGRGLPTFGLNRELADLERQIDSVRAALNEMIAVRNQQPDAVTPPPVTGDAADALKKFAEQAQRVIETFKIMQAQGEHTHRVVERLRDIFAETQVKLRGLKDPFGEEALRLRKILAELAELPEIKLRLRIDTTTRELRQMTEAEVAKLTADLTRPDSNLIPKVAIRPLIDTSLATQSVSRFLQQVPAEMARALERVRFDVLRDRLAEQLGTIPIAFEPVGLDRFTAAVDVAIAAQNRLNLARLGGDRAQIIDAEQRYATAIGTVREALGQLARNLDGTNIKSADQAKALEAINEAAQRLQITLGKSTDRLQQFLNFARAATGIGRAILGIADAMRSVDENIRRTIASAVGLTDALADLAQAQKDLRGGTGSPVTVAASALGAAGAGLSLINSVVTAIQSDNEKLRAVIREQTEIMRENNRQLEDLRLDVGGFTGSIDDLRRAMAAIRLPSQAPGAPSMLELIRQIGEWERTGTGASTRNALEAALDAAGTSLAELDRVAELVGIELFDSAGRLIPDAFALLDDAIELHIRSITQWRKTLDDERTRMQLEADVFDFAGGAQASIDQGLRLLETLAPNLFARFFGTIEIGDPAQVEQALRLLTRTLLDNIDLIRGEFGDLFGRDELIEIIQQVEGGLDGLADAANTVTGALLNVPQGFKLERARFESTLARAIEDVTKGVKEIDITQALLPPKATAFSDAELTKEVKSGNDRVVRAIVDQTIAESDNSRRLESILTGFLTLNGRRGLETLDAETLEIGTGIGAGETFIIQGDVFVDARDKPADELVNVIKGALKTKARQHGLTVKPSEMLNI